MTIDNANFFCYYGNTSPRLVARSREVFCAKISLMTTPTTLRRIVLVDGENLRFALERLLATLGSSTIEQDIENFNYRGMIEEMLSDNLPTSIMWFGAKLSIYRQTPDLQKKTTDLISKQAIFVNKLQQQGIYFNKTGRLIARETKPCKNCRHTSWTLSEKGVDVGLAVKVMTEAQIPNTEIVVISADTDLLPAFRKAKKLGTKIMHIGYEYRTINALVDVADTSRVISLPLVQNHK